MDLSPPLNGLSADSLDSLVLEAQAYAKQHGYAVVKKRLKASKRKEVRKAWLRCDRGLKIRTITSNKRIHGTSRTNECPFMCTAIRDSLTLEWRL